ncbi:MAG: nucleotidyltransferase family protein, partial [Phycisphaerae bacterium]
RMMHLLERIALRFNRAEVPLMVLKGAALNLTLYEHPDERPMGDLDLMVRASDEGRARALLEAMGGLRGDPLVREDFFPRFYYELEYSVGRIYPVRLDLHVRPFRPLRYARTVPDSALWADAAKCGFGQSTVLVPCAEDMLIHLCVHAAIHGCTEEKWVQEIKLWCDRHGPDVDWGRFGAKVQAWKLAVPVREALGVVRQRYGRALPTEVRAELAQIRTTWRDRLVLRQAPRDAGHPWCHVLVNLLCTPGVRFRSRYLRAVLVPDRAHMADWYGRRHFGWLLIAHVLRGLGPVGGMVRFALGWRAKIEVKPSPVHGVGVFAKQNIKAGEVIGRYYGKPVGRDGTYVVSRQDRSGRRERFEITGKLRFLNHSCRPNARLDGFALKATESILAGQEIRIRYEGATCACGGQHSGDAGRVAGGVPQAPAEVRRAILGCGEATDVCQP